VIELGVGDWGLGVLLCYVDLFFFSFILLTSHDDDSNGEVTTQKNIFYGFEAHFLKTLSSRNLFFDWGMRAELLCDY
jgi:hypothetical protein